MKFVSLQVLRALAALVVSVYHAQSLAAKYTGSVSHTERLLGSFGKYGVDLFFVLSGFVILYTLNAGRLTPRGFLLRRLMRIVPMYWLLTLALVGSGAMMALWSGAPFLLDVSRLAQSLLFISYPLHTQEPVLYVGWTVEYEMFFYLLTALMVWASWPVYRSLGLVFLASFAALHALVPGAALPGSVGFFVGSSLILEFVLGLFIAQWLLQGRPSVLDAAILIVVFTMVFSLEGATRVVYAGIPAAVLVWLALKAEPWIARSRLMHTLAHLGDASYSIYLVQVMVLPAMGRLLSRLLPGMLSADAMLFLAVAGVAATGLLLYRTVERPLLKRMQAALLPARMRTAAAV